MASVREEDQEARAKGQGRPAVMRISNSQFNAPQPHTKKNKVIVFPQDVDKKPCHSAIFEAGRED